MYGQDRPRAFVDQPFKQALIQVKRIRVDIDENRLAAAQDEGVHRGNKGERWDDDLVTWLDVQQQGCHLQGMGTGGGQQHLGDAELLLQESMATLGEVAVA